MKKLFVIFFLILFVFSNCSESIKLSKSGFRDVVPMGGNISFTFNQDIVSDEQIDIWDTTQYILFDPPINGKFKWKSKRHLIFSPTHFLRPATSYSAKFNDALSPISTDEENIEFHTPFFDLNNFKAYYAKVPLKTEEIAIRYDFEFNYNINPKELKKNLKILINGKKVDFELLSHEQSSKISVYTIDFDKAEETHNTEIIISKGIELLNMSISNAEIVEKTKVLDPDDFQIDNVDAQHDGISGTITVTATQDVIGTDIKNFIEILPNLKYTVNVEGRKIIISSEEFDISKTYVLNIKEGLTGTLGGKLKYEYTEEITFGKLDPKIQFVNKKAEYLSANGNKNVEIRIINVPDVQVKISKVYKNNIISYLGNRTSYDYEDNYDDYDDYYYYDYGPKEVGDYGDLIWEKSISTKSLVKQNDLRIFNLDFQDKIGHLEGLYVVEVYSKNDYWLKARKIISISDIGLITKKGKNNIVVFANSIKTAKPLSNVNIEFTGKNNQLIGSVLTNNDGFAIFNLSNKLADGFEPALITAKYGKDFNYLPLNRTNISTSRFDISGRYENLAGYDAFIYGDRDIYRPGETIHLSTIIRDEKWNLPGEIPVLVKLLAPNGKAFTTIKKTLNQYGSFETDIILPAAAPTGSYSVEVYTSTNVLLSSKIIKIEEFVPDRIKVVAKLNKNELNLNEPIEVNLTATNLFGPPAANRNYEVQENLSRRYFYSSKFYMYNFGLTGGKTYFSSTVRTGKTNAQGIGSETYKYPSTYADMGIIEANYYITLFDETGRPVNRKQTAKIYTQNNFYGISVPDYYNKTDRLMTFPLIVVDKDGKALSGVQANVKIIKHEYKTVLAKSGSYYRYKSEHEEVILQNKIITLDGEKSSFSFTPKTSGRYEIRISKPGVSTYVTSDFYAYGWGSTTNSSFQVNNEGNIDIELDKEKYNVGDNAKVILKTPFSGKVLVTIERNDVIEHFVQNTDKRAISFDLKIKDDYVPNIYISATLIKAHEVSDIPLTVAHGYKSVMVENTNNKIPIEISAVKKSKSKTKQTIKIKSAPNTAITVAVVDEGILQVTGYSSPDPYKFFYRKRALEVSSYNIYPYLFPEIEIKTGREGGGEGSLEKRINPMTNKRFKLVSFWSGILETDNKGNAEYTVDIPQFSGDLRIMAVAYKGKAFGASSDNMKVADPIVISSALPRFLSPKDTIEMSVSISNTTESSTKCALQIVTSDLITSIDAEKKVFDIEANSEKQLYFRLVAKAQIGEAKVDVSVIANGKKYENETDISLRPASPLQKLSGSGSIVAGTTKSVNMDIASFMRQSVDNMLIVSNSPLVQFADDLDYLVGYPYGCVEQTVSSAFPQLYYQDLAKEVFGNAKFNANYNVKEAIRKLQLMQLYNGAMSYWPGYGSETWWGSVFAAHFLIEAKKVGYSVDEDMLDKLLDYLESKLRNKNTISYWFNNNQNKKIAPKELSYSLYVLALGGKPKISTMNYYKSKRELLSLDAQYLLAVSYALSGDQKKYNQILPPQFAGEVSKPVFGGSFYSPIRDEAIALNAMLEVDPDNQQVGIMAKHLSDKLKNSRYLNTQERVFAFLALGKIAQKAAKSDISAKILSDGKLIEKYENKTLKLNTNQLKGSNITIESKGKGNLYYFWEAEGISRDGSYKEEDNFIKVRKTFYDRTGKQITNNTFKQNDLVVIKLSIVGTYNTQIDNVVISDILPAGFEIENPRISSIPGMDWIKNKSYPTYYDVRDDRINLFVNVDNKLDNYYYVVRAVTPGTFQMGPVGADAMYNGEYHSYNGGGIIRILK
ncbi:MAG: alpha-2-macroglobulin family protein [Bacteroidales bacterium]|nr:alpha-2-macroglobulin family protein [Bacteroidales bacterium]MBN2756963.1 alpha-2-macroglobulin family protein [Bacteroidales bacterium]